MVELQCAPRVLFKYRGQSEAIVISLLARNFSQSEVVRLVLETGWQSVQED
jgi:hypothetical protein